MPPLFTVAFYLVSVAMYLVSFFLSKLALLKETEMRKESRLLPGPQTPSRYNPGHFTSVLLFFGITFDPGMLKILKTRHLKAKISYFL